MCGSAWRAFPGHHCWCPQGSVGDTLGYGMLMEEGWELCPVGLVQALQQWKAALRKRAWSAHRAHTLCVDRLAGGRACAVQPV